MTLSLVLPTLVHGQETTTDSPVRDTAGLFSAEAVTRAVGALKEIAEESGVPVLVETVDSLGGQTIEQAAIERAEQGAQPGLYILLSKEDRKLDVLAHQAVRHRLPRPSTMAIRDAFVQGLREDGPDAGLILGVRAIRTALNKAEAEHLADPEGPAPGITTDAEAHASSSGGDLVFRNQVRLGLNGARIILDAAIEQAKLMNLNVNIAVVDDGGHLIAFARMDGARPASGYTALTKATTAATFRQDTGPVPTGTTSPDPLLNLSLQNAASASGGKVTTLHGGLAIKLDGQVIGGVGVGGGSGEQDAVIARAGIEAMMQRLGDHHALPNQEER